MTLAEIIKSKTNLLESAEQQLYQGIEAAEKSIYSSVLKILRSLAQKEGRLQKETINNKFLNSLTAKVLKAVRESTLEKKINSFLPNFEKIETLNDDLYASLIDRNFTTKVKTEIGTYRTLLIDSVLNSVLGEEQLLTNFINPVRDILFQGIARRSKLTDIEAALRTTIKGSSNKTGRFSRYVRQITVDALNQHDGYINDLMRDTYQLDGWMYIGSLIATSRLNCGDLINSTGKLSEFAIRKGVYRTEDIPAIIEVLRKGKGSGWNSTTTAETFAQYRGGWSCRHQIIYIPLTDREKQKTIREA